MRNFKLGSIGGIPIYANVTLVAFLPVLAWLLSRPESIESYATVIEPLVGRSIDVGVLQGGNTPLLIGAAGAVGLMAGVLVHELGHSWAARRYDIGIVSITLWIFGGMARMDDLPEDWHVEFWVALAGPVTSVLVSLVCFGALQTVPASAPVATFVVGWLAVVNLSLALFNMIPAFPMDGGRIFRALLARRQPYATATLRAARLAKLRAIFGAVVAILYGVPMLILIALFVYVAATSESRTTVIRQLLAGYTARDLMTADVPSVSPDATVGDLFETVRETRHSGFPVVEDDGTVVGVVTLEQAQRVALDDRETTTIGSIMANDDAIVAPDRDAFEVLVSMGALGVDRVLVVADGEVLGVVSQADVADAIEVLEGLGPADRPTLEPPAGYA